MFPEDSDEEQQARRSNHQLEPKMGYGIIKNQALRTLENFGLSNSTNLLAEGNLNKGKLHGTTRWHENGNS